MKRLYTYLQISNEYDRSIESSRNEIERSLYYRIITLERACKMLDRIPMFVLININQGKTGINEMIL